MTTSTLVVNVLIGLVLFRATLLLAPTHPMTAFLVLLITIVSLVGAGANYIIRRDL